MNKYLKIFIVIGTVISLSALIYINAMLVSGEVRNCDNIVNIGEQMCGIKSIRFQNNMSIIADGKCLVILDSAGKELSRFCDLK